MLAIDVSGSMQAEDFKPNNRLYVAKQVVADFIKGREFVQGSENRLDQIGMVVFAGRSFTQCPLTSDYGILLALLENIQIGMMEDGTAIGMALANCVNRLIENPPNPLYKRGDKEAGNDRSQESGARSQNEGHEARAKSKIVILLTDGQNNKGEIDPVTAARLAQSLGIKVYTVGVGREGGAPIPIQDPFFGKVYARGPDGRLILTQMDEETLKEIAQITGGDYFRAVDKDSLKEIYQKIDKLEKTKIKIKHFMEYTELFHYFAAATFILLTLSILLENTRFRTVP
jgi:Ca-activated chloride channel family protein